MLQPCLKWEGSYFKDSDFRTGYTHLPTAPNTAPPFPQTHALARKCEWETQDSDYSWHSSPSILHNQAWKSPRSSSTGGLCQILLHCPPRRRRTKPQLLAWAMPMPPSMKLKTWGQMANSNLRFSASFQTTLAWPDGILCLPGIN